MPTKPGKATSFFDSPQWAALADEGDEPQKKQERAVKAMAVDMNAILEKLKKIQTPAPKVEDKNWIKNFVGTQKFFIIPFSSDEIWKERNTLYLDGRYAEVSDSDIPVVEQVRMSLFKAGNKEKGKQLFPRKSVTLQLQDATTGEVKLLSLKYDNNKPDWVGTKVVSDIAALFGDREDPTTYALDITGVEKTMANSKKYIELSASFARKPSKQPLIAGDMPKYDETYLTSDELTEKLNALIS